MHSKNNYYRLFIFYILVEQRALKPIPPSIHIEECVPIRSMSSFPRATVQCLSKTDTMLSNCRSRQRQYIIKVDTQQTDAGRLIKDVAHTLDVRLRRSRRHSMGTETTGVWR